MLDAILHTKQSWRGHSARHMTPSTSVAFKQLSLCGIEYHVTTYSTSVLLLGFAGRWFTTFSFFVSASPKNPCKICTKATPSAYVLAMRTLRSLSLPEGDRMHVPYLVVSDCHRIKSGPNDTSNEYLCQRTIWPNY